MRRASKLLSLLVLVGSIFINVNLFVHVVNATYVEGHITQDTTWTLVDSPFIVINDVFVDPGVKLTIEPGVEVRFGGNFTLRIDGNLSAVGTGDRRITFTSNRLKPSAKDWKAIAFGFSAKRIVMKYCVVEYATWGILLNYFNGVGTIEKGIIRNSDIGIDAFYRHGGRIDGNLTIINNEIQNNRIGIFVYGGLGNVTVLNNRIFGNVESGISIGGSFWGYLNVLHNKIYSNEHNGIAVWPGLNVTIKGNIISANGGGSLRGPVGLLDVFRSPSYRTSVDNEVIWSGILIFDVDRRVNLTDNSISFNQYGVYYFYYSHYSSTTGKWHYYYPKGIANFNDIYENTYGMNVSGSYPDSEINATHNYWGDPSGPYHESLNPTGKGNPVNGDGRNLDFIPFLSAPIGHVNERPTAQLDVDKSTVTIDQTVTFDASASSDDGQINKYFFDFGDGTNSSWTTLSVIKHNYTSPGVYNASLIVVDDFGVQSTNSANVTITVAEELPQLIVSMTINPTSITSEGQVSITAHITNGTDVIEGALVELVSDKGGTFSPPSGYTDSNGDFTTTFTAPTVSQQTNVRVTATASKTGYADNSDYKYLSVLPPGAASLSVTVTANPNVIQSGQTSTITVRVTDGTNPVADANVILSLDEGGTLSATSGYTNSSGYFTSTYTAPTVTTQTTITITATATKTGYLDGQDQTQITVNSIPPTLSEEEQPDTTLWLYLAIIVIVLIAIGGGIAIAKRKTHKPKEEDTSRL